jgi:pimeloyl-ACP methyl ester carboxylesterase
MLGPDSRLLTALLIAGSALLLVCAIRFRLLPVKILCGALSIVVAMTGGIAAVNYYYGYYTTWSAMWADFHGTSGGLGVISTASSTAPAVESGRIGWINLPGKLSGYDRKGLLYLPPQYGQAKYAKVRFPVVELFHGTPGTPLGWNTVLHISQIINSLLAKHMIGPMVFVMPAINSSGRDAQECLNGPGVNDQTYVTKDVRADILAHYRVSSDSYEWGLGGYSSGGYCAANIALQHPGSYGAAAIINGYFRATDGPAASVLNHSQPLEVANSPLYLAERLSPNTSPLPAFWVAAGTHDLVDYQPATVFTEAIRRIEQVPFVKFSAGDTANAWTAVLPQSLIWMWQQIASPDLRALFPTHAGSTATTLAVPPVKRHHPASCKPVPSRPANLQCTTPLHSQSKYVAPQEAVARQAATRT